MMKTHAADTDLAKILYEINNAAFSERKNPPIPLKRFEEYLDSLLFSVYIHEEDDTIVGFGVINHAPQNPLCRKDKRLQQFAVHPKYQGRGVGKQILTYILDEIGYCPISLSVRPNNDRAIGLYKKFGFEHVDNKYMLRKPVENTMTRNSVKLQKAMAVHATLKKRGQHAVAKRLVTALGKGELPAVIERGDKFVSPAGEKIKVKDIQVDMSDPHKPETKVTFVSKFKKFIHKAKEFLARLFGKKTAFVTADVNIREIRGKYPKILKPGEVVIPHLSHEDTVKFIIEDVYLQTLRDGGLRTMVRYKVDKHHNDYELTDPIDMFIRRVEKDSWMSAKVRG